jgi:hypothetical protein
MAAAVPSVIGGPGWDFTSDLTHRRRFQTLRRRKRTRRSRALLLGGVYRRQAETAVEVFRVRERCRSWGRACIERRKYQTTPASVDCSQNGEKRDGQVALESKSYNGSPTVSSKGCYLTRDCPGDRGRATAVDP